MKNGIQKMYHCVILRTTIPKTYERLAFRTPFLPL
jgi:hypothetical protein